MPLVLPVESGNMYANLHYTTALWGKENRAEYFDVQDDLSQRHLPNDGTLYPYLTIGDFLEDTIIQVPHTLNKSSFFNGNYDAHLIEFLAATAIVDFSKNSYPTTVNKELGIKEEGDAVSFTSFYEGITEMLRCPLTQFVLMSNCFKHSWNTISTSELAANGKVSGFNEDLYRSQFVGYEGISGKILDLAH
jgi:hypothetical protein